MVICRVVYLGSVFDKMWSSCFLISFKIKCVLFVYELKKIIYPTEMVKMLKKKKYRIYRQPISMNRKPPKKSIMKKQIKRSTLTERHRIFVFKNESHLLFYVIHVSIHSMVCSLFFFLLSYIQTYYALVLNYHFWFFIISEKVFELREKKYIWYDSVSQLNNRRP